jgi:hypothetical protein
MRRGIWNLLFLFVMSGAVWAQSTPFYVTPQVENIRLRPAGVKIGELAAGTAVEVLERQSNWAKVRVTCWIWDKSLSQDSTAVHGFEVRGSHILVNSEAAALEIVNKLNQGTPFEELAREFSLDKASGLRGGDLGTFSKGDLRPEVEEAIFRLKVGEVSGVVKSDLGFHILKRTE